VGGGGHTKRATIRQKTHLGQKKITGKDQDRKSHRKELTGLFPDQGKEGDYLR